MHLTRLKRGGLDERDPLYPVTQIRFHFLVNCAFDIEKLPSSAVIRPQLSKEIWEHRAELSAKVTDALTTYRYFDNLFLARAGRLKALSGTTSAIGGALSLIALFSFAVAFTNILPTAGSSVAYSHFFDHGAAWLFAASVVSLILLQAMGQWLSRRSHRWLDTHRSTAKVLDQALAAAIQTLASTLIRLEEERRRSGVFLDRVVSPVLDEVDPDTVVIPETLTVLKSIISSSDSSAVGILAPRGTGKTTLLRWLCVQPGYVGVYLPAPVVTAEAEFIRRIFAASARRVLELAGPRAPSFGGLSPQPPDYFVRQWSEKELSMIERSMTRQRGRSLTGSLKIASAGFAAERGDQTMLAEREHGPSEWADMFRNYLIGHRELGGPALVIAIDELDKIADPSQAAFALDGLKDLFHVRGSHFVVAITDEFLRGSSTLGMSAEQVFDTIIPLRPLQAVDSLVILGLRANFPDAASLFCHAWSGGLPHELLRIARTCVELRHRHDQPLSIPKMVQAIIRQHVCNELDTAVDAMPVNATYADVASLLSLRLQLVTSEVLVHDQLAQVKDVMPVTGQAVGSSRFSPHLAAYIEVASTVSEVFSIPRVPEEWVDSISTGTLVRAANLLADAKAALAAHPAEAVWRIRHARSELQLDPLP
jgi:hypothetical protein